jgi:hypothetical protein
MFPPRGPLFVVLAVKGLIADAVAFDRWRLSVCSDCNCALALGDGAVAATCPSQYPALYSGLTLFLWSRSGTYRHELPVYRPPDFIGDELIVSDECVYVDAVDVAFLCCGHECRKAPRRVIGIYDGHKFYVKEEDGIYYVTIVGSDGKISEERIGSGPSFFRANLFSFVYLLEPRMGTGFSVVVAGVAYAGACSFRTAAIRASKGVGVILIGSPKSCKTFIIP